MQSQDPVYSQNDPLLLGNSNSSQQKDNWKTIAKIATVLIGILFVASPIVFGVSGVVGKNNEHKHVSPTNHSSDANETADNKTEERYYVTSYTETKTMINTKPGTIFTYNVSSDEYSQLNDDGTKIQPWLVKNMDRRVDREWEIAYIHKIQQNEDAEIYWNFNWTMNSDTQTHTLIIDMPEAGIVQSYGGVAELCTNSLETCKEIPKSGRLTIDRVQLDNYFIGIKLRNRTTRAQGTTQFQGANGVGSFSIEIKSRPRYETTQYTETKQLTRLNPGAYCGYNLALDTYSMTNNGSKITPWSVKNFERRADTLLENARLHRIKPNEEAWIYWGFEVVLNPEYITGFFVMCDSGVHGILDRGGKAEICTNSLENCTNLSRLGIATLSNIQIDKYFVGIRMFKNTTTTNETELQLPVNVGGCKAGTSYARRYGALLLEEEKKLIEVVPSSKNTYAYTRHISNPSSKTTHNVESNSWKDLNAETQYINPWSTKNFQRQWDQLLKTAYLQRINPKEPGWAYWNFDLRSSGEKYVEKLEIEMAEVEAIMNHGGKAQMCPNSLEDFQNCTDIPSDGRLTIENPQFETFFLGINITKTATNPLIVHNVGTFSVSVIQRPIGSRTNETTPSI